MPDAVTPYLPLPVLAPGSPACLRVSGGQLARGRVSCLSPSVSAVRGQMLRRLRGRLALVSLFLPVSSPCVSQSLRLHARCCDACSGIVSPACVPVSGWQMLRRLSVVSQSLRSDARCCDAGSAVLPSFEADLACLASSNRRSAPFGSLRLTWQHCASATEKHQKRSS